MKKLILILVLFCIVILANAFVNERQYSSVICSDDVTFLQTSEICGVDAVVIERNDTIRFTNDLIVGSIGQGARLIINGVLIVDGDLYNAFGSSIVVNGSLKVGGTLSNFESELDVHGIINVENGFDSLYGSVINGAGNLLVAKVTDL